MLSFKQLSKVLGLGLPFLLVIRLISCAGAASPKATPLPHTQTETTTPTPNPTATPVPPHKATTAPIPNAAPKPTPTPNQKRLSDLANFNLEAAALHLQDLPDGFALDSATFFLVDDFPVDNVVGNLAKEWGFIATYAASYIKHEGLASASISFTIDLYGTSEGATIAIDERQTMIEMTWAAEEDIDSISISEEARARPKPVPDSSKNRGEFFRLPNQAKVTVPLKPPTPRPSSMML